MGNSHSKIEIYIFISVYLTIMSFILLFNRPIVSNIENRRLTSIPYLTIDNYISGRFNKELLKWFSDTIPFRDKLISASFCIKYLNGIKTDFSTNNYLLTEINDDNIDINSIINKQSLLSTDSNISLNVIEDNTYIDDDSNILEDVNDIDIAEYDKKHNFLIVGKDDNIRVMSIFAGVSSMNEKFPKTINEYKECFPDVQFPNAQFFSLNIMKNHIFHNLKKN